MIKIDAMGDACPLPVIKAKKALKEDAQVLVYVDNEIATQNLTKMANQLGFKVEIEKVSEKAYQVFISSENSTLEAPNDRVLLQEEKSQYIVAVHTNTMGHGNEELGRVLLKGFIYALTEQDDLPTHVLFYNGGAELTTEGSPVLDDLKQLEESGVEILTCGACLDYLALKEKLSVGEVTNMYRIVELMSQFHVVKP